MARAAQDVGETSFTRFHWPARSKVESGTCAQFAGWR